MTGSRPNRISVDDGIAGLTFLSDRAPDTTPEESADAFAQLSEYRDGGVYIGHWAGKSECERHPVGDEIVMVLEGETTIFFRTDDGELASQLRAGDLLVVPQGTWHRFETPDSVKVMSVTPQPTDHRESWPI